VTPQERVQDPLAHLLGPGASRSCHSRHPGYTTSYRTQRHANDEARSAYVYWSKLRTRQPCAPHRSATPIVTPVSGEEVVPVTFSDTSAVAELKSSKPSPHVRRKVDDTLTGVKGAATSDEVRLTASNLGS
jgi:hypothetical protein